jgi:hypothetical protein
MVSEMLEIFQLMRFKFLVGKTGIHNDKELFIPHGMPFLQFQERDTDKSLLPSTNKCKGRPSIIAWRLLSICSVAVPRLQTIIALATHFQ